MSTSQFTGVIDNRRKGERIALFLITCLASLLGLHILDLGLDNLHFKLTLVPILIAGFAFSYSLDERYHRVTRVIVNILAVVSTFYFFRQIINDPTSLGNWLGMLLGVLMVLLSFVAFAPVTHRMFATIGIVFTLFSAAASYELKIVIFFPIFMALAGCLLYFSYSLELAEKAQGFTVSEDNLNEKASLRWFSALRIIIQLVFGVFILSIIVYVIVPHYTDVNRPAFLLPRSGSLGDTFNALNLEDGLDETERTGEALNITRFSEEFDLSGSSSIFGDRRLFESDEPAIAMRSSQNSYLRGVVFDLYTGRRWMTSTDAEAVRIRPIGGRKFYLLTNVFGFPLLDFPSRTLEKNYLSRINVSVVEGNQYSSTQNIELNYDLHTQEIEFLKDHPPVIFTAYQPIRIENLSAVRRANELAESPVPFMDAFSIVRTRLSRHPAGFRYNATVLSPRYTRSALVLAGDGVPEGIRKLYLQLPTEENLKALKEIYGDDVAPVSERVRRLARTIVSESQNVYEKVQKIYDYLMSELTYTLDFPPLPAGAEATEYFLFKTQNGFCMQFASAMAVLLRLNDIPARVVAGYAPGQYSIIQNKYIFKDKNAHAWVEVYFDGIGWVPFDPSPTSSDIFTLSGVKAIGSTLLNFLENLFVIDPQGARLTLLKFLKGVYTIIAPIALKFWYIPVVLVGFLLFLVIALHFHKRIKRFKQFYAENEIVECFREFQETLSRYAMPREAYETAGEYYGRISYVFTPLRDSLKEFIDIYSRAAFSGRIPTERDISFAREFTSKAREYIASASGDEIKDASSI